VVVDGIPAHPAIPSFESFEAKYLSSGRAELALRAPSEWWMAGTLTPILGAPNDGAEYDERERARLEGWLLAAVLRG